MNKSLFLLLALLLTGCASFQVSTLNHDPIYSIEGSDAEITIINNEFELQHLLRTDFNFRYDFAQYALRQPISFDWRFNRFNRYNYWNPYMGYNYYWNRDQMWNDWVWGYPYGNGIGWSYSWNNRRWSSNHWGNTYGWNNYYGWGNGYGWNNYNRYRGTNVAYHRGRRSGVVNTNGRAHAAMIQSTKVKKRRTVNIVTPPRKVIRTKPVRRTRTVIPSVRVNTPTRTTKPTRITSNRTQPTRKVNSRRKN